MDSWDLMTFNAPITVFLSFVKLGPGGKIRHSQQGETSKKDVCSLNMYMGLLRMHINSPCVQSVQYAAALDSKLKRRLERGRGGSIDGLSGKFDVKRNGQVKLCLTVVTLAPSS